MSDVPNPHGLTDLGILLDKMLDNPDEWKAHASGYGRGRKHILRHPRGDLALDVTYKHCFDVYGRAVLSLTDREHLWKKAGPIAAKQMNQEFMEFDNRCQERTRHYNRKKFYAETMKSILGVEK